MGPCSIQVKLGQFVSGLDIEASILLQILPRMSLED